MTEPSDENSLVLLGLRQGRTTAVSWPPWSDGGMRIRRRSGARSGPWE
ncbi:hypothetical protein [Nonomuraea africana]